MRLHRRGHPVKDRNALEQFALAVPYCQGCGRRWGQKCWWFGRVVLHIHHLVKDGRSDEPCNLMRLCGMCHGLCHGLRIRNPKDGQLLPSLQDFALQLGLKRFRDPERWNPVRLAELLGRNLPEPAPVPGYFDLMWAEQKRNKPCPSPTRPSSSTSAP